MMAATIVQIPTPLIICAAGYLAGMWLTALYIGMAGFSDDNFCIVILSLFWPLFLLFDVVASICGWLEAARHGCHGERVQEGMRRIGRVLHYVSLPFRPYTLGRGIAGWAGARRRSRKAGDE